MALTDKLSAIGNAIREKNGTTDLMTLEQMPQAIADIQSGGTDAELENKLFTLEGDCRYKFAYNGWGWLINEYGDRIKIGIITNLSNLLYENQNIAEIPFDLNITAEGASVGVLDNTFTNSALVKAPYIRGNISLENNSSKISVSRMFYNCSKLKEIPYDFFDVLFACLEGNKSRFQQAQGIFYQNYSLRELPNLSFFHNTSSLGTSTYSLYYSFCENCYALDEIINIPMLLTAYTTNAFNKAFYNCGKSKRITFKTNDDGTVCVASWKSQTIDLSAVGVVPNTSSLASYGFNNDKRVVDAETYQALKNDPDWWTVKAEYSRYNHDSAVETINSLPDTSAYLAEKGGTNTIKFAGARGSATDGGAINTLTEEEIAVATAKGWTVTLS